jgi:lysophospholipase L1-like esterase
MKYLRICIIGDSNSSPHQIYDRSLWHIQEMYWYPLCELDFDVIPIAFVQNNTKRILEMSDFFIKNTKSDVFIIQIGVNDLTAAAVKKNILVDRIYKRISKTIFGKSIINLFYKTQQNKIKTNIFENDLNNVVNYIKKFNDVKKFIFLSIPYGHKEKNPLIIKFNSIIEKISIENNGEFLNYFYEQEKDSSLVSDDGADPSRIRPPHYIHFSNNTGGSFPW